MRNLNYNSIKTIVRLMEREIEDEYNFQQYENEPDFEYLQSIIYAKWDLQYKTYNKNSIIDALALQGNIEWDKEHYADALNWKPKEEELI